MQWACVEERVWCWHEHAEAPLCRSEDRLQELILFFHDMGPGNGIQVLRFSCKDVDATLIS